MPNSCLYFGQVMHRRLRPMRHRFVYDVFSILIDLDDLPKIATRLRLFSHNRFNLFSLRDRDFGRKDAQSPKDWALEHLRSRGIALEGGRIFLHAFPRVLGFVFNPLAVYFCYDSESRLRAVLYAVSNTFRERHGYLLEVPPEWRGGTVRQSCNKDFYVSPFIQMEARYAFRLREPEERYSLIIHETDSDGAPVLVASQTAARRPLTDASLLKAALRFPFLTAKVFLGIHWEALKLWIKGAPYFRRPAPPAKEVS